VSDFFDDLVRPLRFDLPGVDEAVLRSHHRLLTGGMSRFDFVDVAFQAENMRSLPLAHLIDHRVRGPLVPPLPVVSGRTMTAEEWMRSAADLEQWFGHMLEASDRRGARPLVSTSLQLEPRADAVLLARLGGVDRAFYRACVRGRLGTAINRANGPRMAAERTTALLLVARLLVYFCCFSVQLVAARAWWIDHLPFRQDGGSGPYREAALLKDLLDLASSINQIGAYMAGKRPRYPSRALVVARRPLAAVWRKETEAADDEMRGDLNVFFDEIRSLVRRVRKAVTRAKAVADVDNQTVHKLVYGVTSGEALSFAVDRLIQLRRDAEEIVQQRAEGREWKPLPVDPRKFPAVDDRNAATLLYVRRIVTLDDRAAAPGADAVLRDMSTDPGASLAAVVDACLAAGDLPGTALRKEARKLLRGSAPSLSSTRSDAFALRRHYDVCPDFWLQIGKVEPLPPVFHKGRNDLLERKRQRDEEDRRRRPPNVRLASGRDPSRGKRRPSR
jgi:hypothetical protein